MNFTTRLFVNRAKDAGTGLWKFDAKVVDGVVNGSASSTVRERPRIGLVGSMDRRWAGPFRRRIHQDRQLADPADRRPDTPRIMRW